MFLRNNRIGLLDLSTGESSEQELQDESDREKLSSVYIAERLLAQHGADSLVLGTGILTASFVPAAGAGIISSRLGVVPVLGFAGMELKLSGFDFVVLKGSAKSPGYVWIRDGMIELVEASGMKDMDSWSRTDKIRSDQGDSKIHVLAGGLWSDSASPAAQLVIDHWGGEDKVGMGAELGTRNLVAVAMRGMGEIELAEPEKHMDESVLLMREHIEKLGANEGLASYSDVARRDDFGALVHRHVACYGCPFPCRSFLKIHEPPQEFRLIVKEPGYLHYDVPALQKAFSVGLDPRSATEALIRCARACAEPVAVFERAHEGGAPVTPEALAAVTSTPGSISRSAKAANFEASFGDSETYLKCLGMGLCPRYWSKAGFDQESISRLWTLAGIED